MDLDPPSRLCNADFRFVSAWVQGLDVHEAWNRFMSHRGTGDLRRVRSTVRTLLDQLAAVAKRHGDDQAAVLLRRDPSRIKAPALGRPSAGPARRSNLPTLEEFAGTLSDADFYSEAELIELFEARHGRFDPGVPAAGRGARRVDTPELRAMKRKGRLVGRQLEAIRRLESLAASRPVPADPLVAWLDPRLARRLAAAGLHDLAALQAFVRLHGYRWYRRVPRVGVEGAGRLLQWLRLHQDSLGPVAETALVPVRSLPHAVRNPPAQAAIVPIERLSLPPGLCGREGRNRADPGRCRLRAADDREAVLAWIAQRAPGVATANAHTFRAYRKEAERLLLWALFERGRALSSLDAQDCEAYRRFLGDPGARWRAVKAVPRWSEHWRPFQAPLAPRSRRMAENVAAALCRWLVEVGWLSVDPWPAARATSGGLPAPDSARDRAGALRGLPAGGLDERLRLMVDLALACDLGEADLSAARLAWLQRSPTAGEGEGGDVWRLRVTRRGRGRREFELPPGLARGLADHLARRCGGRALADIELDMPIFASPEDPKRPLSAEAIRRLMQEALGRSAGPVQNA